MERALAALEALVRESRALRAEPVVMFVEQPAVLERSDALILEAKRRMRELLDREGVFLVETAPNVERQGGSALFRDGLHPNADGNAVLAKSVAPAVRAAVRRSPLQSAARTESREAGSRQN